MRAVYELQSTVTSPSAAPLADCHQTTLSGPAASHLAETDFPDLSLYGAAPSSTPQEPEPAQLDAAILRAYEEGVQIRRRLRLQLTTHTQRLHELHQNLTAGDTGVIEAHDDRNEARRAHQALFEAVSEAERQLTNNKRAEATVAFGAATALAALAARYPLAPTGAAAVTLTATRGCTLPMSGRPAP